LETENQGEMRPMSTHTTDKTENRVKYTTSTTHHLGFIFSFVYLFVCFLYATLSKIFSPPDNDRRLSIMDLFTYNIVGLYLFI